jgi:hypothetical protein
MSKFITFLSVPAQIFSGLQSLSTYLVFQPEHRSASTCCCPVAGRQPFQPPRMPAWVTPVSVHRIRFPNLIWLYRPSVLLPWCLPSGSPGFSAVFYRQVHTHSLSGSHRLPSRQALGLPQGPCSFAQVSSELPTSPVLTHSSRSPQTQES